MHRIDTTTRHEDLFGAGRDGFDQRDAPLGNPGTQVSADFLNGVQEELAAVVEDANGFLVKGFRDQVLTAVRRMIADEAALDQSAQLIPSSTPRHVLDVVQIASGTFLGVGDANLLCSAGDGIDWFAPPAGSLGSRENRAIVIHPGTASEAVVVVSDDGVYGGPTSDVVDLVTTQAPLHDLNWSGVTHQSYRDAAAGQANVICCGDAGGLGLIRPGTDYAGMATEAFVVPPNTGGGGTPAMKGVACGSVWDPGDPNGVPSVPGSWTHYAIIVGDGGYIARSTDDGETWTRIDPGVAYDLTRVAASGPHVVAAAGASAMVSHDGGLTWAEVTGWGDVLVEAAPGGRFMGSSKYSRDGGDTWIQVDTYRRRILPNARVNGDPDPDNRITPSSIKVPHAIHFDGRQWRIYAETNGDDHDSPAEFVMMSRLSWGA